MRYSAIELFYDRAIATVDGFVLDDGDVRTVLEICRRLDGMPLALELAAARVDAFGVKGLAARLDDRFAVLTKGRRTALPRHQTLRAAIDWSYELLAESEQHLLRLLSVFPAGFTLDAAIAIVGEPAEAEPTMVEGLANLVAKSLVVSDQSIPDRRWRLLETIRAYGLEQLTETGEAKQAERRHAEFFRDLETSISLQPNSQPSVKDLSRQGREIDNIRAALDWSFSPAGDAAIGIVLAAAYVPVWLHLGLMAECRDQIERALEHRGSHPHQDARVEMQLAIALGVAVTFMMGSVEKIRDCLARGIEIAKNLDDVHAEIRALWVLWTVHFNIGACDEAETAANQFSLTAHRADDAATILVGDRLLGNTLQYRGRQREARYYFERVLDRYVSPEDQQHTIWFHYDQRALARAMLARVLWLQGFADQAIDHAQASLEEARASAHELSVLYPLAWTVYPIRLMTGDLDGAERALAMASHLATTYNATFWQVLAHCLRGKLLIKRGDFEAGLALLGTGLDTCGRTGWTICYPEFLSVVAEGLAGLGQLVEARATIDQALQRADRGGERWYVPEILRIKGELLLRDAEDRSISPVEDCFNRALEVAQEQDALFWELRVALSLARLRVTQDRQDDARCALSSVYNRFTEGFDTADLKAAKALLEALQ
jgi:predicted ATPase